MSITKLNNLSISAITALPSGVGGKVLQVVSTSKSDTFSLAATLTYTDITGLSVSITPSSAANKILVLVSVSGSVADGNRIGYRLMRGATSIGNGTPVGDRQGGFAASQVVSTNSQFVVGTVFLDSPNTTSATTYKVQMQPESTGYIGRSPSDANNSDSYGTRTSSSITVMEIAG